MAVTRRGRAMASWDGTHRCLGLDGLGTSFCNTCSTLGSHKGAWGRFQAVGWQICKSCIKSEDGVCYTYSSIGISICIIVSAPVPVPLPLPVSSRSCRRLQASSTGARRLACSQWAKEDKEQQFAKQQVEDQGDHNVRFNAWTEVPQGHECVLAEYHGTDH